MRQALALVALAALGLAACTAAPGHGGGAGNRQVDALIGDAIGDPSTCLIVADATTGKDVYTYGDAFNCLRGLPACDAPGLITARSALAFATRPGGRMASCASVADGSRTVGWAEGRTPGTKRALIYSAVMEGERALPGHEINARLYDAFQKAGM